MFTFLKWRATKSVEKVTKNLTETEAERKKRTEPGRLESMFNSIQDKFDDSKHERERKKFMKKRQKERELAKSNQEKKKKGK